MDKMDWGMGDIVITSDDGCKCSCACGGPLTPTEISENLELLEARPIITAVLKAAGSSAVNAW